MSRQIHILSRTFGIMLLIALAFIAFLCWKLHQRRLLKTLSRNSAATRPPFDVKAYLAEMLEKFERKEEFTICEKRALLRTGNLPYKALLFPESLTPAERNRCQYMPPPDEVEAGIRKITNGAMSRPEELLQKAIDTAETMPDAELALVVKRFDVQESLYEKVSRLSWATKSGRIGELAYNALETDLLTRLNNRAWDVYQSDERYNKRIAPGSGFPVRTSEQITAYHANERRLQQVAAEKVRRWEEEDKKLYAEAKTSMFKMADELDAVVCPCKACSRGGQRFCKSH